MGIDLVDRIEARSRRSCDEQISCRPKCQVVCRHAGFKRRKDENLAVVANLEYSAAAIAHIEIALTIECDPGCDAHSFCVSRHRAVWRDSINRAVKPRGNIHLSFRIK